MYVIDLAESVEKSLIKIPKKNRLQICEKIDSLTNDPRPSGCKKLQSSKVPLYRIRAGDYRIIYTINDSRLLILIVEVGHRKEIYR